MILPEYINPEKLALSDDFFKLAVLEEVQKYFMNRKIIIEWQNYVSQEINETSEARKKYNSFDILCEIVRSLLVNRKITKESIRDTFENHHQYILERIYGHLDHELPVDEQSSINAATVDLAKDERYLVSSMDYQFHLVRNIVTKPKSFNANESNVYQAEITDSKGNVQGLARLNMAGDFEIAMTEDEQEYWKKLRSAFNSMDEMTADIFDIICFLYLFAPKDQEGFLYFHSNDALKLRSNVIESTSSLEIRQRDRFNIMSRVKALSNIWVSLKEGEIIEVDDENDLKDNKKYKYRDWQRMFEIGKVRAAYDENDQFLGIYACQIKPTSLLTSFLNENKRLGVIDLSALEFHPIRQRTEKRLARYLSIQWFIRLSKNNLTQSFTVRTLIQEMDFGNRLRGTDVYERFIKALNELKAKGIVKTWEFTEDVDFSKFGKKGWLPYFYGLKIIITPSTEIINKNRRKLSILENHYEINSSTIDRMLDSNHQVEVMEEGKKPTRTNVITSNQPVQENSDTLIITIDSLTPDMVIKERNRRQVSISKAANEIGIGYNTLKRFENNLTKRRNKNNDLKIVKWLNNTPKLERN